MLSDQEKSGTIRNMSKNIQVNITMDEASYTEFEKVAAADHIKPQDFIRLLVGKFGDVKIGHGLSALTSIPKDHFKGRPGRVANEPAVVS